MKQTSMVTRTKEAKLNALIGKLALAMAQQQKDPVFEKYKRSRLLFLKYKQAIIKKYKSKATQAARRMVSSSE